MKKPLVAAVYLFIATACPLFLTAPAQTATEPSPDVMRVQVMLDRLDFSPGVIDGKAGRSLALALKGFQQARGAQPTGKLDDATKQLLQPYADLPTVIQVTLAPADFAGPFVGPIPSDPAAQAKLPAMGYSDVMEELAERYHTTRATLIALNSPETKLAPGATIRVPNVRPAVSDYPDTLQPDWRAMLAQLSISSDQPKAAKIVVDKSEGALKVFDDQGKLVAQFPATMGSSHDPLPIGHWKIQGTSYLPKFHYNPKLFWDAKPGDSKQVLPPGPNGPVGVVWMDLSKPHYGIHGTSEPQNIGRTESHGCIRLTNWDAARLSLMVKPGTPADFQP